ncbi:MAG: hypothetical protein Q8N81_02765 [bacterium]|nr:hypothetical protein [bacterium]
MHNHDDKNNSSMMWMMMACCLLPILFIVFSGRGIGLPTWLVLGIVAVFAGLHFRGMRKSHGSVSQQGTEVKAGEDSSKDHSGPACH